MPELDDLIAHEARFRNAAVELGIEVDRLKRGLEPYFEKRNLALSILRSIPFATGKHTVESTKFAGVSHDYRARALEKWGEIIEPGYTVPGQKAVLIRDPRHITRRQELFAALLDLDAEWGQRVKAWKNSKADLAAVERERDRFRAAIDKIRRRST